MPNKKRPLIIAVDFDGTLFTNEFPSIGTPNFEVIDFCIQKKKDPNIRLILWTCREGHLRNEALVKCGEYGLFFDAVNENIPEIIEHDGYDSRKIRYDILIEDKILMSVSADGTLSLAS